MSEQQETSAPPAAADSGASIDFLKDVPLRVTVELGRKRLTVAEILKLGAGSVVELDKASGEPLDVYVNDRLVARGEAMTVGERYGVRISEVVSARQPEQGGAA